MKIESHPLDPRASVRAQKIARIGSKSLSPEPQRVRDEVPRVVDRTLAFQMRYWTWKHQQVPTMEEFTAGFRERYGIVKNSGPKP